MEILLAARIVEQFCMDPKLLRNVEDVRRKKTAKEVKTQNGISVQDSVERFVGHSKRNPNSMYNNIGCWRHQHSSNC